MSYVSFIYVAPYLRYRIPFTFLFLLKLLVRPSEFAAVNVCGASTELMNRNGGDVRKQTMRRGLTSASEVTIECAGKDDFMLVQQ